MEGKVNHATRGMNVIFIHSMVDDLGLDLFSFRVFAHLSRRASATNNAYPSLDSIAEKCKTTRKSVIRAIHDLEQRGMLVAERMFGKPTNYRITSPDEWVGCVENATSSEKDTSSEKTPRVVANSPHLPVANSTHKGNPIEGNPNKGIQGTSPTKSQHQDENQQATRSQETFFKEETTRVAEPKKKATLPPLDQIETEVRLHGLPTSDASFLLAHWQANGFKSGRNAVKDWRAVVRVWFHGKYFPSQKTSRFSRNDEPQPKYYN